MLKELKSYDNSESSNSHLFRDANDERTLRLSPSSFTAEQAFSVSYKILGETPKFLLIFCDCLTK